MARLALPPLLPLPRPPWYWCCWLRGFMPHTLLPNESGTVLKLLCVFLDCVILIVCHGLFRQFHQFFQSNSRFRAAGDLRVEEECLFFLGPLFIPLHHSILNSTIFHLHCFCSRRKQVSVWCCPSVCPCLNRFHFNN